jgi:hypothetical protein
LTPWARDLGVSALDCFLKIVLQWIDHYKSAIEVINMAAINLQAHLMLINSHDFCRGAAIYDL